MRQIFVCLYCKGISQVVPFGKHHISPRSMGAWETTFCGVQPLDRHQAEGRCEGIKCQFPLWTTSKWLPGKLSVQCAELRPPWLVQMQGSRWLLLDVPRYLTTDGLQILWIPCLAYCHLQLCRQIFTVSAVRLVGGEEISYQLVIVL